MRRKSQFLIAIAVMVGMLIPAAALAQGSGPRGGLVSADGEVTAGERPLSSSGVVGVVVHLNKPSLSQVSQGMTAAQRVAYAA